MWEQFWGRAAQYLIDRFRSHLTGRDFLILNMKSIGVLVMVFILEKWISSQMGTTTAITYLYIVPVWFATKYGCRMSGLINAVLAAIVSSLSHPSDSGWLWVINFAVLGAVMLGIDTMERKIRSATTMAMTDPLTGLLNRRALTDEFRNVIQNPNMRRKSHTLLLFDCNRFKQINDVFGHAMGDQALIIVANALRQSVTPGTAVARLGGDEFVVFLQEVDRVGAQIIISLIEQNVKRLSSHLPVELTLSVGCAFLPEDGSFFDNLIEKADQRMFRHKQALQQYESSVAAHAVTNWPTIKQG